MSRRGKSGPIFCVGWKAFVHWPSPLGQPTGGVPLTDVNGAPLPNDLADGQQVEIVSWRPRSSTGLSYQIRRVADGGEGWLGASHLRKQAVAQATEDSV
jgi:hypothetical protein